MNFGHLFECMMLVCFGFSWPLNVIKAYKARTAKSTSLAFITLIITGYVAGISAKFVNHQFNYVLAVYFLNLVIVLSNVVVYFRNVALDNKKQGVAFKQKLFELQQKHKDENTVESYSQEENMNYTELNGIANKNEVVLFGGSFDRLIPVTELAHSFEFNFELYNRSEEKISIKDAKSYFNREIASLEPEGVIIHLGDEDVSFFQNNPLEFDRYYLELINSVRNCNKKSRIALVSVLNTYADKVISQMNNHIRGIADSERCAFVNLDNAKLWTPKATKSSIDFAYTMGLRSRKPLLNVAEILYSYACLEIKEDVAADRENLVG